ncbi:MAG: hypothetical protein LBC73_05945 [Oscillospiraceae bacterium]|jgi:hypothetical protein|nr:hypothetical protein [Oscillospiraceae bacterium]
MNISYFYIALIILVIIFGALWLKTSKKNKKTKKIVSFVLTGVITVLGLFATISFPFQSSVPASNQENITSKELLPEPSPSAIVSTPTPSPKIPENMVMIRSITHNSTSKDTHSINFTVVVDYNYDEDSKAVVTLHGRHAADSDTLTSFDIYSEQDIEKGYGSLTFEVDVYYFEKDELFFKAYIHPSPEEWLPIAESEPVNVHLQLILNSISNQLNENTDVDYEWVLLETITTTSAPSNTSDTLYKFESMNYTFKDEGTMHWEYTYNVYERVEKTS